MKIPCRDIASLMKEQLKAEVEKLTEQGKTPYLVTMLIGEAAEQLSYVSIKQSLAEKLGIGFEFVHIKKVPSHEAFAKLIKKYATNPQVTGIIIQQPLPDSLSTDSIYRLLPMVKEIEGHKPKSPFASPLGLSVLTALKYILNGNKIESCMIDIQHDKELFRKSLRHKKVVVAGRGITGGLPVGKTMHAMGISFINTNSKTPNPDEYYIQADVIVTATGKKVIHAGNVKPGVMLLNVGLRRDGEELKGDYDEKEIEEIASYYTKTPGGLGPIDVLYLYKNLIEATKMQLDKP